MIMNFQFLFVSLVFLSTLSVSVTSRAQENSRRLVVIGDSLTEGYGVAKESAYPALLEQLIHKKHPEWKVINSGVSASTSASAPGRVRWVLKQKPDLVILALGANDGLRGQPPANLKKNLQESIEILKNADVKVILAGMKMPPNYGKKYRQEYEEVFKQLASQQQIGFIPFLLDGVAGKKELNQPDGIHPNEAGHKLVAENVFKSIEKYL